MKSKRGSGSLHAIDNVQTQTRERGQGPWKSVYSPTGQFIIL